MEIQEILDMSRRQKFVYSLMNYQNTQPFFLTELERFSGYNYPQQDLRKVINLLINKKVILSYDKIKGSIRYKLSKKELEKLIRNNGVFITNGKFIELTKSIYSY